MDLMYAGGAGWVNHLAGAFFAGAEGGQRRGREKTEAPPRKREWEPLSRWRMPAGAAGGYDRRLPRSRQEDKMVCVGRAGGDAPNSGDGRVSSGLGTSSAVGTMVGHERAAVK